MADFEFLQNPLSKKWVILAPRRAKRPDEAKGVEPVCPFCLGREKDEQEAYRVGGQAGDSNWRIRVIPNKFPFAPIHEVIVLSPDHHKSFGELPQDHVELVLQTYRQRYNTHKDKGQVYIFHNAGEGGGESLPHPHSQLAVVPDAVKTDLPRLDPNASANAAPAAFMLSSEDGRQATEDRYQKTEEGRLTVQTEHFYLFCPTTSQWPDEVWVAPQKRGRLFGETTDEELSDLAFILGRLIEILTLRHGNEFPFNFYIYPGGDWYLRLIPRTKRLGGFEVGTGVFVNTQDPKETILFLKEHFQKPDYEKIKSYHQAEYDKVV